MGGGVTGLSQDGFVSITPERALQYDIRSSTSASAIEREIDQAISRGDEAQALIYRDIAAFAQLPLRLETIKKLSNMEREYRKAENGLGIRSQTDQLYRILAMEGAKLVAGESYDQFALGLTVTNLASQQTDDAADSPKMGIDLLHAAHNSGKLTTNFALHIAALIQDAVDFAGLREALAASRISDRPQTLSNLKDQTEDLNSTDLTALSNALDSLNQRVGQNNVLNLMSHIRSPEDLKTLLEMSDVLGNMTYGIVKLTGRRSLDNLQTEVPFGEFVSRNALAFLIWTAGLVFAVLGPQIFRSRWKRLTLDDDPKPGPIDPSLPVTMTNPKIKKARV